MSSGNGFAPFAKTCWRDGDSGRIIQPDRQQAPVNLHRQHALRSLRQWAREAAGAGANLQHSVRSSHAGSRHNAVEPHGIA